MTGIDEAGRGWNHDRVVGIVLLLAILGIGFFPIETAREYRILGAILAVAVMTLNGAYVEWRATKSSEEAAREALAGSSADEDAEINACVSKFDQAERDQLCVMKPHIVPSPVLSVQDTKPILEKMTRLGMCSRDYVDMGYWSQGGIHKGFRDRYALTALGEAVLEKVCP